MTRPGLLTCSDPGRSCVRGATWYIDSPTDRTPAGCGFPVAVELRCPRGPRSPPRSSPSRSTGRQRRAVWWPAAVGTTMDRCPSTFSNCCGCGQILFFRNNGAAAAAFRELYADPVTVHGVSLTAVDLVARARLMQDALERPEREVLSVVHAGDSVAVAFRLAGRQVGPLETSAGRVPPTGRRVDLRIIAWCPQGDSGTATWAGAHRTRRAGEWSRS
jgi:hypothetical protein